MSTATTTHRSELTPYESAQIRRIAAWKSEPPNPLSELWKRLTIPVARGLEKIIPRPMVRAAIDRASDAAGILAIQEGIRRRAGVADITELKHRPLQECDRLAVAVGAAAEAIAAVEGAVTGAGGFVTTLLDVPLLFVVGLTSIRRIGHCYGYPLDDKKDRAFVLAVMIAAMAGSVEARRERIHRLRELEELLLEETQEDVLTDEALSFLFQLEIFEEVPGVDIVSGSVLNWLFMRRVEETARMTFQERWLRDNGKVEHIEPAPAHARHLAPGWAGNLNRLAYSGCYCMGFGVALPVYAIGLLVRRTDNALTRGLRDGAAAAIEQAGQIALEARSTPASSLERPGTSPALVPG